MSEELDTDELLGCLATLTVEHSAPNATGNVYANITGYAPAKGAKKSVAPRVKNDEPDNPFADLD